VPEVDPEKLKTLNSLRCPVCGGWHPFVRVCPYVKSERIVYSVIKDRKGDHKQVPIEMVTEYFERPLLRDAIVASVDDAEKALGAALDAEKNEEPESESA